MITAIVICIIGAMLSGLVAGLLGLGGGAVLVPLFFFLFPLFDVTQNLKNISIGTALMCIIFTSVSSIYSHHKQGGIHFPVVPRWGALHFIGATVGAFVAVGVSETGIRIVYVVATLMLVVYRLFQPNRALFPYKALFNWALPMPFLSGWLSATIGLGGGNNVQMLAVFGVPIKNAVATASVMGLLIAVPATLVYIIEGWQHMESLPPYSLGYVNMLMVAVIVPITMVTASISARITYMFKPIHLNTLSCVIGILLCLRMGYGLL